MFGYMYTYMYMYMQVHKKRLIPYPPLFVERRRCAVSV